MFLIPPSGDSKDISDRAKNDGQFDVRCSDVEFSTSIWIINVVATIEIPGCGTFKCQNHQPVWDPPAQVAEKVVFEHPELNWDEVYELASAMIEDKELAIDSEDAESLQQLSDQIITKLYQNLKIDH